MIDLNVTTVAGRITRDPHISQTPSGTSVANVTLAVNRRWRDQSGIHREETAFVPIVFFGRPAEWLADCKKGTPLLVSGRLKTESWDKDGLLLSKLMLVADHVEFMERTHTQTEPKQSNVHGN